MVYPMEQGKPFVKQIYIFSQITAHVGTAIRIRAFEGRNADLK
jgi:hypothetical protein